MYTYRDKLLSLIEQAERLMQGTKDPEWKEELRRSIEIFQRMLGHDRPDELTNKLGKKRDREAKRSDS